MCSSLREDNGREGLGCARCEIGGGGGGGYSLFSVVEHEGWVGVGSGDFLFGYLIRGGGLEARSCWHNGGMEMGARMREERTRGGRRAGREPPHRGQMGFATTAGFLGFASLRSLRHEWVGRRDGSPGCARRRGGRRAIREPFPPVGSAGGRRKRGWVPAFARTRRERDSSLRFATFRMTWRG